MRTWIQVTVALAFWVKFLQRPNHQWWQYPIMAIFTVIACFTRCGGDAYFPSRKKSSKCTNTL